MRGRKGDREEDGVAREVFAELVPSFLTQLLRRGDLWWSGNSKITDPRPRAPDFCHSKERVPLFLPTPRRFRAIAHVAFFPFRIMLDLIGTKKGTV